MTRNAVILIFVCALSGALFYIWKSGIDSQAEKFEITLKANLPAKGRVGTCVYALRDMKEGTAITADALVEQELAQNKIPAGAISKKSVAVGKLAKYEISAGQIITVRNLFPMNSIVRATKDISQGSIIPEEAVQTYDVENESVPDGLGSWMEAAGRKAKHAIRKGDILRKQDIEPLKPYDSVVR